jgi:peptidoglycan/LPS O-acetylase OafA/YrhL
MISLKQGRPYRADIDGLRALAVMAVLGYHYGFLANGYLGVDVFFVISGYLITGIIYQEMSQGHFSLGKFYLRRIRRIIPLALLVTAVALAIGIFAMLPDDLENLADSVIATNFFSNNILQAITTKNYWDVVNEYKPLMHTWSLGVEEQYYLAYPLLLMLFGKSRKTWLMPILCILTMLSVILCFLPFKSHHIFFYLPFRFYELSVGGIAAILLNKKLLKHSWSPVAAFGLLVVFCFDFPGGHGPVLNLLAVGLALAILVSANEDSPIMRAAFENPVVRFLGLSSYSIYMWHQVLLAYARYLYLPEIHAVQALILVGITIGLSAVTYYWVETPCRDKLRMKTVVLIPMLSLAFMLISGLAFYVYARAGVLRDVPELGITTADARRGMHAIYNDRIRSYNRDFVSTDKIRVLLVGHSFARDWANVLLESRFRDRIEISYHIGYNDIDVINEKSLKADIVFAINNIKGSLPKYDIPRENIYVTGNKRFGVNNGLIYNHHGDDYYGQRVKIEADVLRQNMNLKQTWDDHYLGYMEKLIDEQGTVPVFTPSGMFISQDYRHLTPAGAQYFAELFDADLQRIFGPYLP